MQQQLRRPNALSQLLEFTLSGQISYPMKILNHLRSLTKISDEYLEGTEDGYSNVGCPLRVDGRDLLRPASPGTPENTAAARKYCSHWHKSNIDRSFYGRQAAQEEPSSHKFCLEHHAKCSFKVKKERKNKMNGRANRQMKGLEAAREKKKQKFKSKKMGQGKN
jgi:hypothetical protein